MKLPSDRAWAIFLCRAVLGLIFLVVGVYKCFVMAPNRARAPVLPRTLRRHVPSRPVTVADRNRRPRQPRHPGVRVQWREERHVTAPPDESMRDLNDRLAAARERHEGTESGLSSSPWLKPSSGCPEDGFA